jgi:ribosome-associated protein
MKRIFIKDGYITLGQLLKLSGAAQTGGQAKFMIADGKVKVNGSIALQRGKKILPGDTVKIDGQNTIKVVFEKWKK